MLFEVIIFSRESNLTANLESDILIWRYLYSKVLFIIRYPWNPQREVLL